MPEYLGQSVVGSDPIDFFWWIESPIGLDSPKTINARGNNVHM